MCFDQCWKIIYERNITNPVMRDISGTSLEKLKKYSKIKQKELDKLTKQHNLKGYYTIDNEEDIEFEITYWHYIKSLDSHIKEFKFMLTSPEPFKKVGKTLIEYREYMKENLKNYVLQEVPKMLRKNLKLLKQYCITDEMKENYKLLETQPLLYPVDAVNTTTKMGFAVNTFLKRYKEVVQESAMWCNDCKPSKSFPHMKAFAQHVKAKH